MEVRDLPQEGAFAGSCLAQHRKSLLRCMQRSGSFNHELGGKYSERVQLLAKAKFGVFVANTWRHLTHLVLDCCTQQYEKCKQSPVYGVFDRYFHIPLPIVNKHELGLPFPLGTFPSLLNLVQIRPQFLALSWSQTDTQTNAGKIYSLAFAGRITAWQPTAVLSTGRRHIILSPVKNIRPCDAAFRRNSLTTCWKRATRPPPLQNSDIVVQSIVVFHCVWVLNVNLYQLILTNNFKTSVAPVSLRYATA